MIRLLLSWFLILDCRSNDCDLSGAWFRTSGISDFLLLFLFNPQYLKRWRLVHLPTVLSHENHKIAHKNTQKSFIKFKPRMGNVAITGTNFQYFPVLSHGTIYLVCSSNFWFCGWDPILCYHLNETSSAVLSHGTIFQFVVLTFESVDEILWCYHSNETSSAVLTHGTIWLVCSSNFGVCGWNPMMLPFKWNLSACTYTWCYCFSKFHKMKFRNLFQICLWLNLTVNGLRIVSGYHLKCTCLVSSFFLVPRRNKKLNNCWL